MQNFENELRLRKIKKTERGIILRQELCSNQRDSQEPLPLGAGFFILSFIILTLNFFKIYENSLPHQLSIKESHLYPGRFIGERAELDLKHLTQIGPRVVGSYENEVLAVDFLTREISFIAQQANSIHKIEVDVQKATGSYYLFLNKYGFQNFYANIQNIVVKLSSGDSTKSVLLNCHYDTVPESPGASDNGINCSIMLEILRVLSSEKVALKNNVIFLFNGAEENPLQGSHAFSTQHKWRDQVSVVVNLDSAGAGGKEMLFQTSGETWLIKSFAKSVPRPSGGVHAEELFLFGIIPSDTDFRIFRDFGHYAGLDFAHCTNGYVYHTKYDTMKFIQPGVYQHTGDNILALVRTLVNSPELGQSHAITKSVYFDVFNLFFVFYSAEFGKLINCLVVLASLITIFRTVKVLSDSKQFITKIFLTFFVQVFSLLLCIVLVLFISKILDWCNSTLSWLLHPWLIIPLYAFPVTLCWTFVLAVFQTRMTKDSPWAKAVWLIIGAQFEWTLLLFFTTIAGIRSSFILMLFVLFPALGTLFTASVKSSFTFKKYIAVLLLSLLFPVLFILHQTFRIFVVLIPMTARMGPSINPEVIMGILTIILLAPYLSQIVPIFLMLKNLRFFLLFLGVIHIMTTIGIIFTEGGFPFSVNEKTPASERFYVFHHERTFYNSEGLIRKSDSGFLIQSMDGYNIRYLVPSMPALQNSQSLSDYCSSEVFCGFPVFTSRFAKLASTAHWIPSDPPYIDRPTSLDTINKTQISYNVTRIELKISGPDHISVGISPKSGFEVVKWSFGNLEPIYETKDDGRKTFLIYFSYGTESSLEFFVDIQGARNESDVVTDIAVIGHYMHNKRTRSDHFNKFLLSFPKWAHLTPWITTYKSWQL